MADSKYTHIITEDGTTLIVQKRPLIDLLPDPREAAKGPNDDDLRDEHVNHPWTRGSR
jgi:hypothetical protein